MSVNKTLLIFALVCSFFSTISFAEKYQFVGTVGMLQETIDFNGYFPDADLEKQFQLLETTAKVYMRKVDTQKGPVAKAELLSKSSFVAVQGQGAEMDYTAKGAALNEHLLEIEHNNVLVSGRFVTPAFGRSMIAEAAMGGGDLQTAAFGVGTYLVDSQARSEAVIVRYERSEHNDSIESMDVFSVDFSGVQNFTNGTFVGSDLSVVHQVSHGDMRKVNNLLVSKIDYYFNRRLSVGLIGEMFKGDGDGFVFGVQGAFFPVESLGVKAYFAQTEYTDFNIDQQGFGLELEVRI